MRCFVNYILLILFIIIVIKIIISSITQCLLNILLRNAIVVSLFSTISFIILNINIIIQINKGILSTLYLVAVIRSKLRIDLKALVSPHPGQLMFKYFLNTQTSLILLLIAIETNIIMLNNINKFFNRFINLLMGYH